MPQSPIQINYYAYIDAIRIAADKREKNWEILYESPGCFRAGIQIEKSMKTAKLQFVMEEYDEYKMGCK